MLLLYLSLTGVFAGLIGSVIGVGGGILIVPVLTLIFKIPIHIALGTSIISVLVTSLTASIRYFKKNTINIPLGLTLEIPATIGGIIGSITVAYLKHKVLFLIFAFYMIAAGIFTFYKNRILKKKLLYRTQAPAGKQKTIRKSILDSSYYDQAHCKTVYYKIKKVIPGSSLSIFAGLFSGLLGIGGGAVKVSIMHLFMDVPLKVATSTSIYMISLTAVVSSIIYYYNGFINPAITIPVVTGILAGATVGSFTALKIKSKYIAMVIVIIFSLIGILMLLRGFGIIKY